MSIPELLNKSYDFITGEMEGRTCEAIPEKACTHVPENFFLNLANGSCTKLAEQLASPGLVLPWLMSALGVPSFFAGWLVPIRQAGSMLPQMLVAGAIRGLPRRKFVWIGAGMTQAVMLGLMAVAALNLTGVALGWSIIVTLAIFSIASGAGSVAFGDVVGKTIPRKRRGLLLGWRSTVGGVLTIAAGLYLKFGIAGSEDIRPYIFLLLIAGLLWLIAAILFALIKEVPGATSGGSNAISEIRHSREIIAKLSGFRRFLYTRTFLLIAIEISLPFYALHAKSMLEGNLGTLGIFVLVSGLSQTISSSFWGKFADISSRRTMILSGVVGALTAGVAILIAFLPKQLQSEYTYSLVFLLHGIALAGVRLGRKTWLVDAAPADDRPTWIALSNTIIGLVTVAAGLIGLIGESLGLMILLYCLAGFSLLGSTSALLMPEADAAST